MSEHFSTILDSALANLRAGEPIESILANHPSRRDELAPLLLAAQELSNLRPTPPLARPEDGLAAFLEHARNLSTNAKPEPSLWHRLIEPVKASRELWWYPQTRLVAGAAIALVLLFTLMGSAITLAATSLPGDWLYPAKLAGEEIRLSLTSDQITLANNRLARARTRAQEIERLAQASRPIDEAALVRLDRSLEAVLLTTASADPSAISQLLAEIEGTTAELTAMVAAVEAITDDGNGRQAQMLERARLSLLQAQQVAGSARLDTYAFQLSAMLGTFQIGSSTAKSSDIDRLAPADAISP
jgi:hypothetical protein